MFFAPYPSIQAAYQEAVRGQIDQMHVSRDKATRRLADALETCYGCDRRCPGPHDCTDFLALAAPHSPAPIAPTPALNQRTEPQYLETISSIIPAKPRHQAATSGIAPSDSFPRASASAESVR